MFDSDYALLMLLSSKQEKGAKAIRHVLESEYSDFRALLARLANKHERLP
jgi:hypothetical protein